VGNAHRLVTIAKDVYRVLGSGFSEDVYDRAMQVGLRLAGIRYESQKVVELRYRPAATGRRSASPYAVASRGCSCLLSEWRRSRRSTAPAWAA
jgi:hypothetical protein